MDERNDLELLLARVEEVRETQRIFFKNRNDVNLAKAKNREAALDAVVKQMQSKGYNGDRFKQQPGTNKLF